MTGPLHRFADARLNTGPRGLGQGRRVASLRTAVLGDPFRRIGSPAPPAGHGYAYEKLKRKIGDYATAAAAVVLTASGGKVTNCSIGLTNVAETPLWAEEASKILTGSSLDAATVKKAVAAAEAITSPASDARGPAAYRTKMAGVMLTRALARAKARAGL